MSNIPFNKAYITDDDVDQAKNALTNASLAGNGKLTKQCQHWLENHINAQKALLTHSCTAALELAALLIDTQPNDEIIMPSFTFVSTANAFVLRGGTPVFVDIREDTLNIDETKIEAAITPKTTAIVPMHYAGVGCEMDKILQVAHKHNLYVIEDNAQGIMASYKNKPLGSFGDFSTLSFHETKNIICGEGGALLINNPEFIERAEILLEKGTNRKKFFKGEIDKYTWVDIGSSFLPSEITAALLSTQLNKAADITQRRLSIWNKYHGAFAELENKGVLRRPIIPNDCKHNAHIYYLLLSNLEQRDNFIAYLKKCEINTVFHYTALHQSHAGKKYAKISGSMTHTEKASDCLVRLPLWVGLEKHQNIVIKAIYDFFSQQSTFPTSLETSSATIC